MNQPKGITLIALVITIIILLILAGITIATLTGENGMLAKATQAKEEYQKEQAKEKIEIAILDYRANMKEKPLYIYLEKIEGLESIRAEGSEDYTQGPPFYVIVDGYEFFIKQDLSIEYIGTANGIKPQIIKTEKQIKNEREVALKVEAKTEDKEGLSKLILFNKGIIVEEREITGKEVQETFIVTDNGEYTIKVIATNKKQDISEIIKVTEIAHMSGLLMAGTVIQREVQLTVQGESNKEKIKKIEIFVGEAKQDEKIYEEGTNTLEEQFTITDLVFYEDIKCYAMLTDEFGNTKRTNEETVKNTTTIATTKGLENLAKQVNTGNTFKGKTISLIEDITTGSNWVPIGYWDGTVGNWTGKYFAGTLEGNDHFVTIPSLSKNVNYKSSGLFGMIIGGTVNNLRINGNMDAECIQIAGIVGAIKDGVINNCINNSQISNTAADCHGGIVGQAENSQIQNCSNTNTIYGKSFVGGICGMANKNTKISNSTNSGLIKCYGVSEITNGNAKGNVGAVGGICGQLKESIIEKSENIGEITGNANTIVPNGITAGGIAGQITNSNVTLSKNKSRIHFDIPSTSVKDVGALGGIVGHSVASTTNQCFNTGIVTSKYNNKYGMNLIGGIVGYMNVSTIKNSYNLGEIYGEDAVGGIVGHTIVEAGLTGNNYLYNNYNASEIVEGNSRVGNFIGVAVNTIGTNNSCIEGKVDGGYVDHTSCSFSGELYRLDQMKAPNSKLFQLLNQGEGANLWTYGSINEGLPYLKNNTP
jgi:type II secretory pathway pseudopilin PulG